MVRGIGLLRVVLRLITNVSDSAGNTKLVHRFPIRRRSLVVSGHFLEIWVISVFHLLMFEEKNSASEDHMYSRVTTSCYLKSMLMIF